MAEIQTHLVYNNNPRNMESKVSCQRSVWGCGMSGSDVSPTEGQNTTQDRVVGGKRTKITAQGVSISGSHIKFAKPQSVTRVLVDSS